MRFYSALLSTAFYYASSAAGIADSAVDVADYNNDIAPFDIDSLGANDPINVILMRKPGISSAAVYPMSLSVTAQFTNDKFVAGVMTKQQYEDILNDDTSAWSIEPDGEVTTLGDGNVRRGLQGEDEPFGIEMVLQDVEFFNTLDTPSGTVKVCVADTGYELGHPDLPQTYATGQDNPSYTGDDGKWYVDGNGHGTHCAGTVAAIGDNGIGVVGVIPNDAGGKFEIMVGKALTNSGSGSWSGVMKAVELCVENGANVVSMSLGGSSFSSAFDTLAKDYYEKNDILFVAAAGNGGNSGKSYPASFTSVMSVASLTSSKARSSFSQYNDQVEISGPGSSVHSTYRGGSYRYLSGTSMATPHVAAVAGLLWMHFPECKNYQIRNVILSTAEDLGAGGCDVYYGHGLVQAKAAFEELLKGDCGGHLGYTDASKGGCAQLDSTAPSYAPVVSPTNPPVAPTNAPNTPVTAPTMYPTHRAPTPYPTEVPPTPYPTGAQCADRGEPCSKHKHCCKKKCNRIKGICRQ